MNEASLRSYNAIIDHTITEAIRLASQSPKSREFHRRGIAGFCQLQGPTGGGKSSSLFQKGHFDDVPAALEIIKNLNYQSIFVTHRWNILHDVYQQASKQLDTQGRPYEVSVLYAQDENMIAAVTRTPLPHEHNLEPEDLPCCFSSIEALQASALLVDKDAKDQLLQSCNRVKLLAEQLRLAKKGGYIKAYLQLDEERLSRLCSRIERLLLKNMNALEKQYKKTQDQFGAESEDAEAAKKRFQSYRKNSWVRRVFPGIAWRDEHQHLLIMTTQKLFSSFYDGKRKVRMSSGELSDHVIFIDEFDYQSDVLQQMLSQAQLVQEPPECLGQLLEGGKRLLKRMQYVTTDPVPSIYSALKDLVESLEEELDDKSIDLTDARALLVPVEQEGSFKTQYLFRSDHLVTSSQLSMHRVDHGYEVKVVISNEDQYENAIQVGDFLRLMEQFIRRFSLMVSDLSVTQDDAHEYLVKLSRLLFDPANDYRPSHYSSALPNISQFSLPRSDLPELDTLRESNLLANTHANIFGLANWLLKQNVTDADIDPHRLQIRRAFLPTTPEGLLVSLCSRNLVFGLSATSYIERAIGSFDLRWVKSALRYIAEARTEDKKESYLGNEFQNRPRSWFSKAIPYLQTEQDLAIQHGVIRQIQDAKRRLRQSQLSLCIDDDAHRAKDSKWKEQIANLPISFFQTSERPITEKTKEHRSRVLLGLLNVIDLAGQKTNHKGQLAFVNSIRFLKKWLFTDEAAASRNTLPWLELECPEAAGLYEGSPLSSFKDTFIPARVHGNDLLICLLTAECQKRSNFHVAYQAAFETGRTVLVLTQTASATNGINLDFTVPSSGKKMDLSCLYLLEAQHFYFAPTESEDVGAEMAHAGYQLRNLEKLMRAGEISRQQHRGFILPIMENSSSDLPWVNGFYKRSTDYVKNTAADVQQQIGRIERAWEKVPHVEIHITKELATVLTKFTSLPEYTNNKQQISELNNQLLDDLQNRNADEGIDLLSLLMTPQQTGDQAVDLIDGSLVPAIRRARELGVDEQDIIHIWRSLGKAVLQLDYAWKPRVNNFGIDSELYKWACIEKPDSDGGDQIWYDRDTWQFFSEYQPGRAKFDPNSFYQHIIKSPCVIDWFNKRGYRTSIHPSANSLEEQYLFHPKVVQRLLQGRLGEEAIRAHLSAWGITTQSMVDNVRAFELFDFKVVNKPIYIDAKFWGASTLNEADRQYQDWLASGANPAYAPLGLVEKLKSLRGICGQSAKLVIANFVGRGADEPLHCFDPNLNPVSRADASILVLDGCVSNGPYEEVTFGFDQLIKFVDSHMLDGSEI